MMNWWFGITESGLRHFIFDISGNNEIDLYEATTSSLSGFLKMITWEIILKHSGTCSMWKHTLNMYADNIISPRESSFRTTDEISVIPDACYQFSWSDTSLIRHLF